MSQPSYKRLLIEKSFFREFTSVWKTTQDLYFWYRSLERVKKHQSEDSNGQSKTTHKYNPHSTTELPRTASADPACFSQCQQEL